MVADTNVHIQLLNRSALRACFIATHVCVCTFSDLRKFTLLTCSEKPEVDIMMPSFVSEAKVIW